VYLCIGSPTVLHLTASLVPLLVHATLLSSPLHATWMPAPFPHAGTRVCLNVYVDTVAAGLCDTSGGNMCCTMSAYKLEVNVGRWLPQHDGTYLAALI
jgi:hypothetical protein